MDTIVTVAASRRIASLNELWAGIMDIAPPFPTQTLFAVAIDVKLRPLYYGLQRSTRADRFSMYALNESLAFLLSRAGAAVGSAFTQELRELQMTLPMWRVIAALWGNGDQSLGGLSEVTSVETSTLSRQVAALVERGFVSRRQSAVDWRAVYISLTPSGRVLVERLLPSVERHERAALDGISAGDIRRLKQLLSKVYANLMSLDEALPAEAAEAPTSKRSA